MFAYHDDAAANRVLNILDRESRGVVQGIESSVLEFKWRLLGLAESQLAPALQRLTGDGLLRAAGRMLRLTAAGYARLTDEARPEIADHDPAAGSFAGRPTEYGVRDKLLGVFRSRAVASGGRLSAAELSRYWEVAHYRAADLRSGLDLLLRDGHAKVGRFGQALFRLERDGHDYLRGAAAPEWMRKEAVVLAAENLRKPGVPDRVLCVLAVRKFHDSQGREVERSFYELDYLLERYQLPDFLRFHACELLHRLALVEVVGEGPALRLTEAGRALQRASESGVVQWSVQQALGALLPAEAAP